MVQKHTGYGGTYSNAFIDNLLSSLLQAFPIK